MSRVERQRRQKHARLRWIVALALLAALLITACAAFLASPTGDAWMQRLVHSAMD